MQDTILFVVGFALGWAIGRILRSWSSRESRVHYAFVSMEDAPDGFHNILTLEKYHGANPEPETVKFYGNCTVWHRLPDYKRCNLSMECMLSDFWTEAKAKGY